MTISVLDRKMLWGRSGMKCAMCKTPLSQQSEVSGAVIIGEEAHIVSQSSDGPRGSSPLTKEDRDRYSNLILLCPTDHARIDKLPDDYPVEMLLSIKAQHEAAVMASDSFDRQQELTEENWARLIDQLNDMTRWQTWSSNVAPFFDPNFPWVEKAFTERLRQVSRWIYGRFWPEGHENLKSAIEAFGQLLADWMYKFEEHMEIRDSDSSPESQLSITTERFYHIADFDSDRYDRLLKEYEYHVRLLADLALEATRYGNYIFRLVRDEIDPSFRFDERMLVITIPAEIFEYQLIKPQFESSDFDDGEPYKNLETFDRERSRRDIYFKGGGYS
jgi:hypothetical protein